MALHEQSRGKSDEWYTPPYVFDAMEATFDLDPCPPFGFGGLDIEWAGFVWMNPPFGGRNGIVPWLEKFMKHGNGVALCPDRSSAPWWQHFAIQADLVLFVAPKIHFIPGPGVEASSPAQGTCLLASGSYGQQALRNASRNGLGKLFQPC